MSLCVLGIDPGFASVGYALVEFSPKATPIAMGVIRTQKATAKRKVRASDDNMERAKEITRELSDLIAKYSVKAICAETMSFPRNAGAAAKMAMCWGVIAALTETHNIPVVQASPQEVKKAVCGKKDASKEEVQASVKARYPVLEENVTSRRGSAILRDVPASQQEHPFDALAVVEACKDSDVLLLIRRMVADARHEQGNSIR